jgi:hypothetical protein
VPIDESLHINRQLQLWSHGFAFGSRCSSSGSILTSISPVLRLILAVATRSPAATTALTALVRSVCRNADGARAISTTVKSAYRWSCSIPAERRLEVVQAVAHRAECRLVVPAVDGEGAGRVL